MTRTKHFFVASILCLFWSRSTAQPVVKIIAYEQTVLPGTVPAGVTDEQGNKVNTARAGHDTTFFIYFLHPPTARIQPATLWIGGKCFDFAPEAVKSTPVTITFPGNNGTPDRRTMVPRTTMTVMRLNVTQSCIKQPARPPGLQKKGTPAAVLIGYKWQGKMYYAGVKELTVLPPLLHQ
jgi:hypothetical protein